jgi:undecaprenyl-diphosphatase
VTGLQAFVLGVVQGITEFLPISSSGHLIIVPWLLGWDEVSDDEQFKHTFDVATNVGTLLAVVAYFWRDLLRLLASWLGTFHRCTPFVIYRLAVATLILSLIATGVRDATL